jgi:carbamoyltransferase
MMVVLGVHAGYKREHEDDPIGFLSHDGAAALVSDSNVLAAIEDERLTRVKHSNSFPASAIRRVLAMTDTDPRAVDYIALNTDEQTVMALDRYAALDDLDLNPPVGRTRMAALLSDAIGYDVTSKLRFCGHHMAHAWSAFAPSGFDESLVVCLDGGGELNSGAILVMSDTRAECLKTFSSQQSLGDFYTGLIRVLGYSRFDEYKVMALAPYGTAARFSKVLADGYRLLPGGNYAILEPKHWIHILDRAGLLEGVRRRGGRFNQTHTDLAAAIQATLEDIVMHVLRHYRKAVGTPNLCLAGGVAHNCSLNGAILYSGLFNRMFVQPAAHDAGGALGAAWATLNEVRRPTPRPTMKHVYLGSEIGDRETIQRSLDAWKSLITYREASDVTREVARLLADGGVVGWVQGRAEFGPRALGNRSILADPRPSTNKALINSMVKKREEYRPFAPAVSEARLHDYFDVPNESSDFPFMVFVVKVRVEKRELLGAVTHVDGTARVQTVSHETNPLFADLIREFEKITGVPILLNTSFNNNAEPIVDSIDDAVSCFLTTGLNWLVAGPFIVSKARLESDALLQLAPAVAHSRKLVRRTRGAGGDVEVVYALEHTKSRDFGPTSVAISRQMFKLLQESNGREAALALIQKAGLQGEDDTAALSSELLELWRNRAVALSPSCAAPSTSLAPATATSAAHVAV